MYVIFDLFGKESISKEEEVLKFKNVFYFTIQVNNDGITVSCLEYASDTGKNCFKWPKKKDIISYFICNNICLINAPSPINQRGHFSFSKDDIKKVASSREQ